jgi:phosphonoacetaldehyde hydrolase
MVKQIEAVILDWAGTTVDHGSLAPVKAVGEVFARNGIQLSDAEARRDMGIYKKDHIRNILQMPSIAAAWLASHGAPPNETDVETLFAQFIPLQFEVLEAYSTLISGVSETVSHLRAQGLKIGSTTGYTRPMLDVILSSASKSGYSPDLSLCPDDVGGGRPYPWMCLRIAQEFKLSSVACAVKVGDTVSDIEEAHNAGMWAVGVVTTGNEVGVSASELAALPPAEREQKVAQARERLHAADYLIDDLSALPAVLAQINTHLQSHDRKGVVDFFPGALS